MKINDELDKLESKLSPELKRVLAPTFQPMRDYGKSLDLFLDAKNPEEAVGGLLGILFSVFTMMAIMESIWDKAKEEDESNTV